MPEEQSREERVTAACRWVAAEVAAGAPAGIGDWPGAWEYTAPFEKTFQLALRRWERTGRATDYQRAKAAGEALIAAWKEAGYRWHVAKRAESSPPPTEEKEPAPEAASPAPPAGPIQESLI